MEHRWSRQWLSWLGWSHGLHDFHFEGADLLNAMNFTKEHNFVLFKLRQELWKLVHLTENGSYL